MEKSIANSGFKVLLRFYIKAMLSSLSTLMSPVYFALLSIVLFSICIGPYKISETIIVGITFAILSLSLLLFAGSIVGAAGKDNMLQNIYLSGIKAEVIILAKLCLLILSAYIISIVTILLGFVLLRLDYQALLSIFAAVILFIPATASVLLFVNFISFMFPSKMAQFILAIPLLIPCMILATKGVEESMYLLMMLGANFIYLPIFIYASVKILPHAAS